MQPKSRGFSSSTTSAQSRRSTVSVNSRTLSNLPGCHVFLLRKALQTRKTVSVDAHICMYLNASWKADVKACYGSQKLGMKTHKPPPPPFPIPAEPSRCSAGCADWSGCGGCAQRGRGERGGRAGVFVSRVLKVKGAVPACRGRALHDHRALGRDAGLASIAGGGRRCAKRPPREATTVQQ